MGREPGIYQVRIGADWARAWFDGSAWWMLPGHIAMIPELLAEIGDRIEDDTERGL